MNRAEAAVLEANALEYGPVRAEAVYVKGRAQARLGRYETAAKTLEQAYLLARRATHDRLSAEIGGDLAHLYGFDLSDVPTAKRWAERLDLRGEAPTKFQRGRPTTMAQVGDRGILLWTTAFDFEIEIRFMPRAGQPGLEEQVVAVGRSHNVEVLPALDDPEQFVVRVDRAAWWLSDELRQLTLPEQGFGRLVAFSGARWVWRTPSTRGSRLRRDRSAERARHRSRQAGGAGAAPWVRNPPATRWRRLSSADRRDR